jgi:hypothetical protein
MSGYDLWIKQHLAAYKTNHLGVSEHGIWKRNGKPYAHILPEQLYKLNIIETYRHEFWRYFAEQAVIKRHNDFHHLNSSQAMCFNLFYPFLVRTDLLADMLGFPGETPVEYGFERILDPREGTNFDFYTRLKTETHVLFELKLSESGFGTTPADARHREKLVTLYYPRLVGKVSEAVLHPDTFFRYYQLLRNISYLKQDSPDRLFFIFPFRNSNLVKESSTILTTVTESLRNKIKIVHLETFVDKVLQKLDNQDPVFTAHYRLFKEKYIGDKQ